MHFHRWSLWFQYKKYSFFIVKIFFLFYSIILWGIGIASESKLEVLKNSYFGDHNCLIIFVGKDYKPLTDIGIPTHTRVCLEVNTHTGTLYYFINDKRTKDRVVNVPKDVYFGVWDFICYLFSFIDIKIL
jgi:hypothetical protein